jgi:hypothetical protein
METVTEILVDISGSMKNKMSATKQALLNDILPDLDTSSQIGIKTFTTLNKQLSIQSVLPLSKTDKETIKQAIQKINCSDGRTPIAASIKASVKALSEYVANDKVIILVTDGAETEKGDYVQEAKNATADGINCKIHVIGIDLKAGGINQANEIAKITGGTPNFISFGNGTYNQSSIRSSLSSFYQAVRTTPIVQQTYSPSVNHSALQITKVAEPETKIETQKEEIVPIITEAETTEKSSPQLDLIVEQIKEIRKELSELKKDKVEIPDIIEDAEHNEKIRKASEEYLFEVLKKKYPERVKWLNEKGESNSDHDFEILDLDGTIEYYIECKGTVKNKPTFYLTKNEWRLFLNHTKNYQIYFVKNSFGKPNHVFIDNLLDWLLKMKIVPYLKERDVIKEERVFLTLNETTFDT